MERFFLIPRLYSPFQSPIAAVKRRERRERKKAGRLHFIFCPFDIVAIEVLSSFFFFFKERNKKPSAPECA